MTKETFYCFSVHAYGQSNYFWLYQTPILNARGQHVTNLVGSSKKSKLLRVEHHSVACLRNQNDFTKI